MIKISSVEGNHQKLDGGAMFGNAPRAVWSKWLPPDDLGRIRLSCRAMLVETPQHRVLCETGIGAFFDPKLKERYGVEETEHVLLTSLEKLGLKDTDIDAVILSHLHFDHAGGLLPAFNGQAVTERRLLFPRAKYIVGEEAWQRACHPHSRDRASFIPGLTSMLEASGRLILVKTSKPHVDFLGSAFTFWFSSGHTPGHMHTIVQGATQRVVFAGDLIPGTAWVHVPITMGYDRYPELLIDEKMTFYNDVVDANTFVFFTHDGQCSWAHIRKSAEGKYQPVGMTQNLVREVL